VCGEGLLSVLSLLIPLSAQDFSSLSLLMAQHTSRISDLWPWIPGIPGINPRGHRTVDGTHSWSPKCQQHLWGPFFMLGTLPREEQTK
jgi:hypothetical protein